MDTILGVDISNYTAVPASEQIQCWRDKEIQVVCIGLQNGAIARAQKAACQNFFWLEYYLDIPGRDLTIPDVGSKVWIDVEPGCFETKIDVNNALQELLHRGLEPSIYGNETSIKAVLGEGHDWANYPLNYANYRNDALPPDFDLFKPFDGWTRPRAWQYAGSKDLCGLNVDFDVFEVAASPSYSKEESLDACLNTAQFINEHWGALPFSALDEQTKAIIKKIASQC